MLALILVHKINWVPGVVESIKSGPNNSLVSLIMPNGENFNFSSTNDILQGIQVGDSITAKVVNGWAESIQLLKKAIKVARPPTDSIGHQWVSGIIEAIKEGPENSLITVKMSNGENFNVAISNDMLQGIQLDDNVYVKVVKGWAKSIEKR
jgi:molybdopterin-binding protein